MKDGDSHIDAGATYNCHTEHIPDAALELLRLAEETRPEPAAMALFAAQQALIRSEATSALVLLPDPPQRLMVAAALPANQPAADLMLAETLALESLQTRTFAQHPDGDGLDGRMVAMPFVSAGECLGALVVRLPHRGEVPRALAFIVQLTGFVLRQIEREGVLARNTCESSRRQEIFFGLAMHELRNPLTVIKTYLDFFAAELSRHNNERLKLALVTVRRNLDRLLQLSQDLLDHTRLELGEFRYEFAPVSAESILEAIIPEAELLCASNGLTFEAARGDNGAGDWDRTRIEQVLLNLIANAVKFSPPGGCVRLETGVRGRQWQVSISDCGIGIPRDELDLIFKPFHRSSNVLAQAACGVGLGLSICRRLVLAHGGTIVAESPGPGQGSTFRVTLPTLDGSASARRECAPARNE